MIGGMISDLFGSDEAPRAVLNRYAAPTAKSIGRLDTDLTNDVNGLSKDALDKYMASQGKMEGLAGQQEGVLNTLLQRRLNADPNALLQNVGKTAFSFIDPNVINPLSQFDVNSNAIMRRARGLNPAAVDSTADKLRNARIASGRYYDVARDAYQQLPGLYNSAFQQNNANENAAAGIIPQIAQTYEGVARRPTTGIMDRINTAGAAGDVGGRGINSILAATQGYKQPRNFADRLGAAGERGEQGMMQMAQLAASVLGGSGGGGSL